MSQTAITLAFEQWKAQQGATGEVVLLDEFIFANVPGLDPAQPIDRNEKLPPAGQIVHRQAVSRKGVVNENAVVHSVVLGADVGDFSFNWIGLINKATGTLAMIVHAPEQQKLKTSGGQQGNVLTRSFLMEYNGAQTETGINTPAETWQIDFTARMAGMDERQRAENIDIYGAAAFLGDGWLVGKTGNQYFVTKGVGYVAGLRAVAAANQNITVTTKPVKVWLDVSWTGALTSIWTVQSRVTVAASLADYVQNGVKHYVFALASIDANGNITDLRPKGGLSDQSLKEHEKSRNHPDGTLNAKGFVQLSSATDSDSESQAATPKAVKAANDNANGRVPSTRKVNSKPLSGDITLSADDVVAVPGKIRGSINNGMTMAEADKTGWWQIAVSDTSTVSDFPKKPNGSKLYGYGYMFVWVTGNTWFQHYYAHHGEVAYRQEWTSGPSAAAGWVVEFNTVNKPAAADVDAVSASGGGTFKGVVNFNSIVRIDKSYPGLVLRDSDTGDNVVGKDIILEASGSNVRLLFRKKDVTDNQLMLSFPKVTGTLYSTGNKPTAGDVGAYSKAESDARYNLKNTASRAANGWFKDNSTGMIFQWGTSNRGNNTTSQTFPIAFPSTCLAVIGSLAAYVSDLTGSTNNVHTRLKDNKSFQWDANGNENKIMFFAIGY